MAPFPARALIGVLHRSVAIAPRACGSSTASWDRRGRASSCCTEITDADRGSGEPFCDGYRMLTASHLPLPPDGVDRTACPPWTEVGVTGDSALTESSLVIPLTDPLWSRGNRVALGRAADSSRNGIRNPLPVAADPGNSSVSGARSALFTFRIDSTQFAAAGRRPGRQRSAGAILLGLLDPRYRFGSHTGGHRSFLAEPSEVLGNLACSLQPLIVTTSNQSSSL